MGCAGLLSYTLRGTGLTSTGFPKIILEIAIVLPLEFDNQPFTPAARSGGFFLLLGWVTSSAKPSPILELILKPSGLVLQTMALGHRSHAFSQFQRNRATTIRLEPIALDFCVCCKSIQKHNQLLKQGAPLGAEPYGK